MRNVKAINNIQMQWNDGHRRNVSAMISDYDHPSATCSRRRETTSTECRRNCRHLTQLSPTVWRGAVWKTPVPPGMTPFQWGQRGSDVATPAVWRPTAAVRDWHWASCYVNCSSHTDQQVESAHMAMDLLPPPQHLHYHAQQTISSIRD